MGYKRIFEPRFWAEDSFGNFQGLFEVGDFLTIVALDGTFTNGSIQEIKKDSIIIETFAYTEVEILYENICDIKN